MPAWVWGVALAASAALAAGAGFWLGRRRSVRASHGTSAGDMDRILERADCMLWQAQVDLRDGGWKWNFTVPPSGLRRRMLGERAEILPRALWSGLDVPDRAEMDRRCREALENGVTAYEQRFRVINRVRTLWLHESVSIVANGPKQFSLVGLITDITAQHEAEEARRASEQQLEQLLLHANCMLWQAHVTRDETGQFHWEWFVPRSELYRRVTGGDPNRQPAMPWQAANVPEFAELEARSRHAMTNNLPGYEQEFRVLVGHDALWMHEQASITPIGPDRWMLEGVVIDITAQRRAEEEQRKSEARLWQVLERADCTLWQGIVTRRDDGSFAWKIYVPPSRLHRRIYGHDPLDDEGFRWDRMQVPEFDEMMKTCGTALQSGAAGYEQVFHVPKPEGDLWLSEQVSITRAGEGRWELVGVITDITSRHEAEEARRASEAQVRQMLTTADCMLWQARVLLDAAPGKMQWQMYIPPSRLYRDVFGSEPAAWRAMPWELVLDDATRAEVNARAHRAVLESAPGYEQEFRAQRAGRAFWLHEQVTIEPVAPGEWRLVGVIMDLTARREAEQAVRGSEQRYRSLFQHMPVAIVESDFTETGRWLEQLRRDGVTDLAAWLDADPRRTLHGAGLAQVRDTNAAAVRLFASGRAQAAERDRGVLLTPDAMRVVRSVWLALWEGRNTFEGQLEMRDFSGAAHFVDVRWWVARSDQGLDLRQSVLVFVDLTELKRAEDALAGEKERLAVTLRAMAEGVITTDVSGRVQFLNPAAAQLIHCDESAVGRRVSEICPLEDDRSGASLPLPVEAVARGEPSVTLPPHARLLTRDGRRRLIEGCAAPIHAGDGKVTGMVLVFRDVTDQERLEQELVRSTRLESVGILAGGIAHDFNNILTGVMGNLALAQLDLPSESEALQRVRDAEKATLRARDLTQQLLTFSKGGEPVRAAVQLEGIVRETTEFALHGTGVKAVYELPAGLWAADVDKGQIGRVVQNLVINAVQAMPEGGLLRLSARNDRVEAGRHHELPAGDYLLLTISDSGTGIKAEHLSRIFDPYFTTKQSGSGLGLAAVYSIVRKHRGFIDVESEVGRGTTFRLWLPALRAGAPEASGPMAAGLPQFAGRVLFMDDEEIIRQTVGTMLRRLGFAVAFAADGREAVEKYRAAQEQGEPFTLVIMDLTVPGALGGREAIAQLLAIDPQVRAIVSSGYSSDPVMANYRAHGFCGRVAKPFQLEDLVGVLREATERPE